MALTDFLTWLEGAGCTIAALDGVPDHVLVRRGGFRAIVPAAGPEAMPARTEDAAGGGRPILHYRCTLTDDEGTVLVTFPDFPGATYGRTRDEALVRAHAFVADALVIYAALGEPWPEPAAPATGEQVAVAPPQAREVAWRDVLACG